VSGTGGNGGSGLVSIRILGTGWEA
jgi:hypothetical protein